MRINIKKYNISRFLLLSVMLISIISMGFSSFLIVNDEVRSEYDNGLINAGDNSNKINNINLNFNRQYKKSDLINENIKNTENNSHQSARLVASLKIDNNNTNSDYSGNIADYFEVYDSANPASDNSPNMINRETGENIYFENHRLSFDGERNENLLIESSNYYQPTYDLVDISNSNFDQSEIDRQMNIVKLLIDPMNDYDVEIQKLTLEKKDSNTSTYDPNNHFLVVYGSRTTRDGTNFEYRYHWFYHIKNSDEIRRVDSSYNTSATQTSNSTERPKILINRIDSNNQQVNGRYNSRSVSYSTSFNTSSNLSIVLDQKRSNNNAGYDTYYDVIDLDKTIEDFLPYKEQMLNYINSLSFVKTPTINNSISEMLSQDDADSNINNIFPWFYIIGQRYKVSSGSAIYYRNYHYFIFYYNKLNDSLCVTYVDSGHLIGNYTSSNWPKIYTLSNNVETLVTDGGNITSSSSIVPNSRFNRDYLRIGIDYFNNTKNAVTTSPIYFDGDYFNNINKSVNQDDFNADILENYLLKSDSDHNNPGANTVVEFKEIQSEYFPFLKIMLSRRRTSENKYYYYKVNFFYYYTGDNSSNNNQIRLTKSSTILSSVNDATSNDQWFDIQLHSEDDEVKPSYISESYHDQSSFILYDISYYDKNNQLKNSSVQVNLITNTCGHKDYNFFLSESEMEFNNSIDNFINSYNIFNTFDDSRKNYFTYQIEDDGAYNFSGYYFRKNIASATRFSGKYSFSYNLYNCLYSSGSTSADNKTAFYANNFLDNTYDLVSSTVSTISQKEYSRVKYVFSNGTQQQELNLQLISQGYKSKFYSKRLFDKINSNNITFDYSLTLKPKSTEIEKNAREILNAFDFTFSIEMKKVEEC